MLRGRHLVSPCWFSLLIVSDIGVITLDLTRGGAVPLSYFQRPQGEEGEGAASHVGRWHSGAPWVPRLTPGHSSFKNQSHAFKQKSSHNPAGAFRHVSDRHNSYGRLFTPTNWGHPVFCREDEWKPFWNSSQCLLLTRQLMLWERRPKQASDWGHNL